MSQSSFQAPRGVPDYLPPRSATFLGVKDAVALQAELAGYEYVELPVFEHIEIFTRGMGESSDIVTKEMYSFDDRGGRQMALRPEGTASVCRAVAQHGLAQAALPVKLWYAGPFFRAERPQQGRYRQLQQVGVEAIGVVDPFLDAEVIAVGNAAFQSLGLTKYQISLNSLGGVQCRTEYREALIAFMVKALPSELQERVHANPLRLLDDKTPAVRAALAQAPLISDFWTSEDASYQASVKEALAEIGVATVADPRLVRGLDYYTGTIFEFVHSGLGAQCGIGGGGRYDGLLAALGGPELSGVGFGIGVDRTLLACEAEDVALSPGSRVQVFIVPMLSEAKTKAFALSDSLRQVGVSADMVHGERGLKGAMKAADRSGALVALIIGEEELASDCVVLKNLSDSTQVRVDATSAVTKIEQLLEAQS